MDERKGSAREGREKESCTALLLTGSPPIEKNYRFPTEGGRPVVRGKMVRREKVNNKPG